MRPPSATAQNWTTISRRLRNSYLRDVLQVILDEGPSTARELAVSTGLSVVTINNLLREFLAGGKVAQVAVRRPARGPVARVYAVPPSLLRVTVLVHRPGRLTVATADQHGEVEQHSVDLHGCEPGPADFARSASRAGPADRIMVAVPSAATPAAAGERVALENDLALRLGAPVRVRPTTELAAVAEARTGAGRHVDEFVLVTEHAATIVVDGVPRVGAHGMAGSLRLLGDRRHDDASPLAGLAPALAAVCLVNDPALVVLGGDLADEDGLPEKLYASLAGLVPVPPRVVASEVAGDAALLGGVAVARAEARACFLTIAATE